MAGELNFFEASALDFQHGTSKPSSCRSSNIIRKSGWMCHAAVPVANERITYKSCHYCSPETLDQPPSVIIPFFFKDERAICLAFSDVLESCNGLPCPFKYGFEY